MHGCKCTTVCNTHVDQSPLTLELWMVLGIEPSSSAKVLFTAEPSIQLQDGMISQWIIADFVVHNEIMKYENL